MDKLSCRACETIVQAPMPTLPIERGRPGPGLVSHVLVSKYTDHTPLHRQAVIYAREGVELDRATLADWVGQAVFLLTSLAEAIGRHIRAGVALHRRHHRPGARPRPGQDQDRAAVGRGARRAPLGLGCAARRVLPLLGGPQGHPCRSAARRLSGIPACGWLCRVRTALQADRTRGKPPLIKVACWAHVRRKFYEVHEETASPIALETLQRIAALFAIESRMNGSALEHRLAERTEYARPLLDQLKTFLDISLTRISGKSGLAEAIRYALARWKALSRYLSDGRLEMTNNAAERGMRVPVLGRKNYLFCGSDAGGKRAACIYTIVETARMNHVNPQAYLTDILGESLIIP